MHIGILIFPAVTQLDATGPAQVLARTPGATLHMIWKTRDPVKTDAGFSIVPTTTFADCPQLDVICIPGGAGQIDLMNDAETLAFVAAQGAKARYVTSVCTGSLVLGAAGLLNGYKSACHWASRDLLTAFGAIPVAERVVRDRNRLLGRRRHGRHRLRPDLAGRARGRRGRAIGAARPRIRPAAAVPVGQPGEGRRGAHRPGARADGEDDRATPGGQCPGRGARGVKTSSLPTRGRGPQSARRGHELLA